MVMIRKYSSHDDAKEAFFANRLALLAGILAPCPKIEYDAKKDKATINMGAFKQWQLKHVGSWNHAVKFSKDSLFMRPNVVRMLIFASAIGLKDGLKDIYWSTDISEFVFTNFDAPFNWFSTNYDKYLEECDPALVVKEAEAINDRVFVSRGLSLFGGAGFEKCLPKFLDELESYYVGDL